MRLVLCMIGNMKIHHPMISVQANLRMQVKPRSGGRSQNAQNNNMSYELHNSSVSVNANLLQQVKSRRDGRSQNRLMMRGLTK